MVLDLLFPFLVIAKTDEELLLNGCAEPQLYSDSSLVRCSDIKIF